MKSQGEHIWVGRVQERPTEHHHALAARAGLLLTTQIPVSLHPLCCAIFHISTIPLPLLPLVRPSAASPLPPLPCPAPQGTPRLPPPHPG
jgi:hypothetical protein